MDTKEKAGMRIKALRQARRLTLQDVSDGTKGVVSPSQLSNFEQGIRMVSVDAAKALAQVLGTLPEYLLTLIDQEPDADEITLIELYRACDERGKKAAFHAAKEQAEYSRPKNDTYPPERRIKDSDNAPKRRLGEHETIRGNIMPDRLINKERKEK
jgi:transcriptional regulator with XRE-family HTH domain